MDKCIAGDYNAFQQSAENWGNGDGSVVGGREWGRYFG